MECALEQLGSIRQIVCSESTVAVLTTCGIVYQLSLASDSQVALHSCYMLRSRLIDDSIQMNAVIN